MPSDKHMEAARALADNWALPETEETCAKAIATALANAEREGMKRAADIAYLSPDYTTGERNDEGILKPGSPYDRGRYEARCAILSEAGEKA